MFSISLQFTNKLYITHIFPKSLTLSHLSPLGRDTRGPVSFFSMAAPLV